MYIQRFDEVAMDVIFDEKAQVEILASDFRFIEGPVSYANVAYLLTSIILWTYECPRAKGYSCS